MDTGTTIVIVHRLSQGRCANEQVYVHYTSELDARMIRYFIKTSPGIEPATYYFMDSRFIPMRAIERFHEWVEQPMT
jgi:hypothetical protein